MIRHAQPGVVTVALSLWATTSGCVTTLGYVQENLKIRQMKDQTRYIPDYGEVKRWAYDVADAYDSRASMNRHMIHFGALFAAAAAGALAGLGAFDKASPAITGIPIGTAFLSGVAAIYSSGEKAVIYGLASRYVKDLIVLSDARIVKRNAAALNPDAAITEATRLRDDAKEQLASAVEREAILRANAAKARADVNSAMPGTSAHAAKGETADALEKLATRAASDVERAREVLDDAEARLRNVKSLKQAVATFSAAKARLVAAKQLADDKAGVQEAEQVLVVAEQIVDPKTAEALCLRKDVNDVMRRVGDHIALLDPKNVADRLKAVGTTEMKSKGDKTTPPVTPGDLRDLESPVKSQCDNAI